MKSDSRNQFIKGIIAELPIMVGVIPFGMIYGVLAVSAGITSVEAQSMSAVVFAGSAQFLTTQLVGNGAPGWLIVLTVIVVNMRHALYSASVAPYVSLLSTRWKTLLAYLLTDEAYAVTITSYDFEKHTLEKERAVNVPGHSNKPDFKHWFFLGAGLTLWFTWQISTAIGIFLGAVIPERLSLDFALPLTFIALLVPLLKDRPSIAAAMAAGATAIMMYALPYKIGLLLAVLIGITFGLFLENRK